MSKEPTTPAKWHAVYRNDDDKNFFVGKDGKSGLARSEYDWRTTEKLAIEAGLTRKRTEEIIEYYCKRNMVIQHKDGEKWGYWERVGATKATPDPLAKDQQDRVDRQINRNTGITGGLKKPTLPGGSTAVAPAASPAPSAPVPAPSRPSPTKPTASPSAGPVKQPASSSPSAPVKKKLASTP